MIPLLSIVIPLHGKLQETREMHDSLLATLPDNLAVEIVYVDDASPDDTAHWLRSLHDPRIRCVFLSHNSGFAHASNTGAHAAQGALLLMANNDLVYRPGWLEPMLDAFNLHGQSLGVLGNVQYKVADGTIDHAGIRLKADAALEHIHQVETTGSRLPKRWAVTGACMMIRRKLFLRLDGFDETYLNGCEDVDLCLKARAMGFDVRVALDSVVLHHVSLTRKAASAQSEANSRLLQTRWHDEFRQELTELWATQIRAGAPGLLHGDLEGELTPYARELPVLTAMRIADIQLAIKRDHWRHVLDEGQVGSMQGISHKVHGSRSDPSTGTQILDQPSFDIEISGARFIRRLYVLGQSRGLPPTSQLTMHVNGMQVKTFDLPEQGNFRLSLRGLITVPTTANHIACRLNVPPSELHKLRMTGVAFKAISSSIEL